MMSQKAHPALVISAIAFLLVNHLCSSYHSKACYGLQLDNQQERLWLLFSKCHLCKQFWFSFSKCFFLFLPVKPEAPPAPVQEKPSLSEEEIERKCKSIIDEFLHINDFKVSKMRTLRSTKICSCGAWEHFLSRNSGSTRFSEVGEAVGPVKFGWQQFRECFLPCW